MKLISLKNRIGADNRRHLSANGFSLLPLALRPRLFCWVGMASVVAVLLLVGAMIVPPTPTAQTYADEPTPAADPSITVTTAGTIALDLMPTSSNGTFAKSSAGEFSVTTTNATGYTLKLKSVAANGTDLKYTYNNNTYTIPTLVANTGVSEADFSNSNNTQYSNKWGYLPSKLNSAANTTYRPAPSTDGDTLDVTEQANAVANDYSITLGARADYTTKTGAYSNTFVIEATANVVLDNLLTINFNGNGLLFPNSSAINVVKYDSSSTEEPYYEKYAHTENFEDGSDTPVDNEYYYAEETVKPVTVTGADHLEISLQYGIGNDSGDLSSYDWLFVIEGEYTEDDFTAYDLWDAMVSGCGNDETCIEEALSGTDMVLLGAYTGSPDTGDFMDPSTTSINVTGDAVTFVFYGYSYNYGEAYGYYATVEGYDSNDEPIEVGVKTVYDRTLDSGSYATPTVASGQYFYGWGTDANGFAVYADENDIKTNMPGDNGGIVTLYAIYGDCPVGKICYNSNNASSNTTMANQTIEAFGDTTLWVSNFWKTGYGFAGWNTKEDGTGINYGPNQSVNISDINGVTLYANWVASAGNFQTVGDSQGWDGCGDMGIGDVTALTDIRDNQVYAVAKLADSNCWMIENLRLNTTGSNDSTKAQGFGGVFAGLANAESRNFSNSTTANSLYSTSNITGGNLGYRFPRYNNNNTNSPVANMTGTGANIYSYGNYYTWAAAIADTTAHDSSSDVINTSICPAGWHLPYGGSGTGANGGNTRGEFYYLGSELGALNYDTDSSQRFRAYPNNFVYSGFFSSSSAVSRGNGGFYWSSTAYGSNSAYGLCLYPDGVTPGTGSNVKNYGRSVRCVLGS